MAKPRTPKKPSAKAAQAAADALFETHLVDALGEELLDSAIDHGAFDAPQHVVGGDEIAWEAWPVIPGRRCKVCKGTVRECPSGAICKHDDHGGANDEDDPTRGAYTQKMTEEFSAAQVAPRARVKVSFRSARTTQLTHLVMDPNYPVVDYERSAVQGAFVKFSIALRPSEREAFELPKIRAQLLAEGARAVLVAVTPVAETVDKAGKAEVIAAQSTEDAVRAWFAGLSNVPREDADAACAAAIAILEAEGAR